MNTGQSAAIYIQRIWWINEFGRLTGYSLVLVFIGTGNCGGLKFGWIRQWWINQDSLYVHTYIHTERTCIHVLHMPKMPLNRNLHA